MEQERRAVPARIRITGHAISAVVSRAPWLWPLLRGPTRRYFSELAPAWDGRTGAGGPEHLASLAAAVLHVEGRPERVLDVGCGTGEAALFLAREYPSARVRGVDLSEAMVAAARAKVGLDPEARIAFKVGDAAALPFPDDSFDLVAQVNVPPFYAELARVLRPGGSVVIASSQGPRTPYYTAPETLAERFRRHGVETVASAAAGGGDYYVGRALPESAEGPARRRI